MEIENIHIRILPERSASAYAGGVVRVISDEPLAEQGIDLADSLASIEDFDRVVIQLTESQYLFGEPRCLFYRSGSHNIRTISEINGSFPETGSKIQDYVLALHSYINNND